MKKALMYVELIAPDHYNQDAICIARFVRYFARTKEYPVYSLSRYCLLLHAASEIEPMHEAFGFNLWPDREYRACQHAENQHIHELLKAKVEVLQGASDETRIHVRTQI